MNEQTSPAFKAMSDAVLAIARGAVCRADPAEARPRGAGARGRPLRRDRRSRRRGSVRAVHHLRDEREADRRDGPAAADARPARRDARVAAAVPHEGPPRRPALQGLVAGPAPGHAVVPRRPDRVALRDRRRLLSHTEAERGGVRGGGPAADRDARRPRGRRDRERAPLRACAGAVDRRGAEQARARPPRLGGAEALRRRPHRGGGLDAARAGCDGGARAARPAAGARRGGARGASLARLRAAAAGARDRGARDDVAEARRRAAPRAPARDRVCACPARRGSRPAPTGRSSGSRRRRSRTRSGTRAREHVDLTLEARDGALVLSVADDGDGFDPADPALRSRRLGLTSMEERARAAGGRLEIDSRPGGGTTVRLEVGG